MIGLTSVQNKVIDYLRRKGEATSAQLAQDLGFAGATMQTCIRQLMSDQAIVCNGVKYSLSVNKHLFRYLNRGFKPRRARSAYYGDRL